ncbi:unnamed protein product [Candidula unifasciata]|uniref:Endonuclease V n=1 Tax=Candidula unifasciata TaxID=100452 RepID=A0A8S3ZVW5_9EUPU|nr:unnamed protein product [Candidula unifasciata]
METEICGLLKLAASASCRQGPESKNCDNLDSQSCEHLHNLDSQSCEHHHNLNSQSCEHHHNLDSQSCETHHNLDSKSCETHHNLDSKSCEPHHNLDSQSCEHCHNLDSKSCETHHNLDSKSCEHHHNLDRESCEPDQNHSHSCGCSCRSDQCCECTSCIPPSPSETLLEDQVTEEVIQNWEREQSEYREKLVTEDTEDIMSWLSENPESKDGKELYVGGADISFIKGNSVDACSCLTIVRASSDCRVVYQRIEMIQLTHPYVPGYLAFREVQPLVDLYNQLRVAAPQYLPDVIMVDGNGILHPRGFGLACHLGVVLGMSTLGVAKTLITTQGIHDDQDHKLKKQTLKQAGDFFDLVSDRGAVLGRCVRTCDKAPNPIYISVGHNITLESATQICLRCSKYRIPEPVRKADIDSREFIRQNKVEPYEFIAKG